MLGFGRINPSYCVYKHDLNFTARSVGWIFMKILLNILLGETTERNVPDVAKFGIFLNQWLHLNYQSNDILKKSELERIVPYFFLKKAISAFRRNISIFLIARRINHFIIAPT